MFPLRTPLKPLVAALLAATLVSTAQAADKTWNCANSSWIVPGCWSPNGIPAAGDNVRVSLVGGAATTLNYPDVTGVRSVNNLIVDASGTPVAQMLQGGGDLSISFATAGQFGNGTLGLGGGMQRIGTLVLGSQANASGVYRLSGGQLLADVVFVGAFGLGSFTHSAGRLEGRALYIGQQGVPTSTTSYAMSGGELVNSLEIRVGRAGGGGSFSQSAGSVQAAALNVGYDGPGSYTASGAAQISATRLTLGFAASGEGSFVQSGGSTRVSVNELLIGQGGAGSYTLSAGLLSSSSATVYTRLQQIAGTHQAGALSVDGRVGGERAGYALQSGAVSANSVAVGGSGSGGDFVHGAGSLVLRGELSIAANGRHAMTGNATLDASGGSIVNAGSFEQLAGTVSGTLLNRGSFVYGQAGSPAPRFNGLLINQGTVQLQADATFGGGLRNEADWPTLARGRTLTLNGAGLDNSGTMTLAGGTLVSNGPVANSGSIGGWGRIEGSGALQNQGSWVQSGGDLTLANGQSNVNQGLWTGQAGRRLVLQGSTQLLNEGSLALNGAAVGGSGTLLNGPGGVLGGSGNISSGFTNEGTLALAAGDHLTLPAGTKSSGLVDLRGATALLGGGSLANSGLIAGQGRVASAIDNSGRIQAEGGVLVLAGPVQGAGVLAASPGGTLLLQRAPTGGATVQLEGGTVDLAGQVLIDTALVNGHGTLRTAGVDHSGRMQFSAGSTQVFGPVTHRHRAQIIVSGAGDATFYDGLDAQSGSELRVSVDSRAIFFGKVAQAAGAAFTGKGTFYFEGGLSSAGAPAERSAEGDVVLGQGNVVLVDIAASGNDRWAVGGALQFGGTLQLKLESGTPTAIGTRFDLFDWGASSGRFAALDLSAAPLPAGLNWDVSRLYVDGSIGVSAVPEPGTWALLLGGLLVMAQRSRRLRAV